jgi:hypothetical protein
MRRVLIALALASMIVVAGCSSGPSGTDTMTTTAPDDGTDTPGDDTDTPGDGDDTATPDEGTETATPPSDGAPPGVNADGSVNTSALQAAHYTVLQGSSFRADVTEEGGPDPITFTLYNGTSAARLDIEQAAGDGTLELYLSENVITSFNGSESPPKTYSYGSTSEQFGAVFAYAILFRLYPGQQLDVGTFEEDGTVTRDGEELTRLSATGVNETAVEEGQFGADNATLTDMSGELLVRSDGLVRETSLDLSFDDGRSQTLSFALSGLDDTTADEPDWIDEAPRLEGSLSIDGTVMELSHAGGPEIPADTTLTLASGGFGGGLTPTNVTLPESVSEGDSVYVYATGNATDPGVEVSVNDEPAPDDAIDLTELSPQVSGTLDEVRFVIGVPDEESDSADA